MNLTRRGWDVTAVDFVPRALDIAHAKTTEAGVDVQYVKADVTDMGDVVVGDFAPLLDVGCFHGLKPQHQSACMQQIQAVRRPGATLLMLAFQPGRRPPVPLPRGASRQELEQMFVGWHVIGDDAADTSCLSAPVKRAAPHSFWLRRRS